MIEIKCDECGGRVDYSKRVSLQNICLPSGIMLSQDLDFCGPECFWKWVAKWPRTKPEQAVKCDCKLCRT